MGKFLLAAGFLVGGSSLIMAQGAVSGSPDLRGIWMGEGTVCHHVNDVTDEIVTELKILEQDGSFLRAERSWAHAGEAVMNAQGELRSEATEILIGVIRSDGRTIHFVEHDDIGQHFMLLIDENTLDDVYAESGSHATICAQTFKRRTGG